MQGRAANFSHRPGEGEHWAVKFRVSRDHRPRGKRETTTQLQEGVRETKKQAKRRKGGWREKSALEQGKAGGVPKAHI